MSVPIGVDADGKTIYTDVSDGFVPGQTAQGYSRRGVDSPLE